MTLDLSNLSTVKKSSVQRQDFDMRFNYKSEKFQLSDSFYAKNNMNNNGLTLHFTPDGKTPLLSIRPNEDSVFYKGKEGDADKDSSFAYGILQDALREVELLEKKEKGFVKFDLISRGEHGGFKYLEISVQEQDEAEEEEETEIEAEAEPEKTVETDKEPVAETQDAESGAEEEEDPFAL